MSGPRLVSSAGVRSDLGLPAYTAGSTIGQRIAYVERTSDVAVSTTVADFADSGSISYDGGLIRIEAFIPSVQAATSSQSQVIMELWDSTTELGRLAVAGQWTWGSGNLGVSAPMFAVRYLTPTVASHQYKIRVKMDAGSGTAKAGNSGAGVLVPGYINITRAA